MNEPNPTPEAPVFTERPTEFVIRDAFVLGVVPLALAGVAGMAGWPITGLALMGLTVFVACFFRNPPRFVPEDDDAVCAPADGRVLEVGEVETANGEKMLRIGIFLSVFNVHVNRCPASGKVVSVERSGSKYLAAFNRKAEDLNVRCALTLEAANGQQFQVVQITGLIARRILSFPEIGEFVRRGDRYGYIRFGSRTDVLLPVAAVAKVRPGDYVKGGETVVARWEGAT
ncbi:MAG: phosphatidylserine decarboxylase family protein [Deltaproteobacteria bacterium]|nr:phosphatidylserine decarboxylase family protein [Deltaproteobacteria bacterium]